MDKNGLERTLSHLVDGGEGHPGNPEEDYVVARYERSGRIEVLEVLALGVGPAESGERPERRAEPGDGSAGDYHLAAVLAVVCRDAVSPPELPGDAPVLDLLEPVEVYLLEPVGHEIELSVPRYLERRLGQRLHLYEPLVGYARLDDGVAAVAFARGYDHVLGLYEVARCVEVRDPCPAAFVAIHALVLAGGLSHLRLFVYALYDLEPVALSDLEVVGIGGRGDLHRACALLGIGIGIRDDGDLPVHEREEHVLADHVLVSLVGGVDRYGYVGKHGLRPGGGDGYAFAAVGSGISEIPVLAGLVLVLDLYVGERRSADRAPVDEPLALVYQSLLIEPAEVLDDGAVALLVHGEALAAPVAGAAKLPDLGVYASAVLLFPGPGASEELLAPELFLGLALFCLDLFDYLHLGRDGRVVGAGKPESGIALHPLEADQDVLKALVERVPHVELAGDVGGRHEDGIRLLLGIALGGECAALFPLLIYAVLIALGVVVFRKVVLHIISFSADLCTDTLDAPPHYTLSLVVRRMQPS